MVKRIKATHTEKQLAKLLEGTETLDTAFLSQRANQIGQLIAKVIDEHNGKKTMKKDVVALLTGMGTLVGYLRGKVEIINQISSNTESYVDYIG